MVNFQLANLKSNYWKWLPIYTNLTQLNHEPHYGDNIVLQFTLIPISKLILRDESNTKKESLRLSSINIKIAIGRF